MYLIEIIPITNLPKEVDQILFYYNEENIQKGSIVSIKLNNSNIYGLVISSKNLVNNKNLIKKSKFKLKKINKIIINKNILNQKYFDLINFFSLYYNCNLSKTVKTILPTNIKSLTNYLLKETKTLSTEILNKSKTDNYFLNKILPYLFKNIENKKQTLILCPTIDYVSYIENQLNKNFSNICNIHKQSNLNKTWQSLLNTQPSIIIGTKKSIFLPFTNLENIVIINYDSDYHKSWDQKPYYNSITIAKYIAKQHNISLIIQTNELSYLKLKNSNHILIKPEKKEIQTEIVIHKNTTKKSEKQKHISNLIQKELKHKSLIFLNNKNFANALICPDCQTIIKCNKCNTPLSINKTKNILICPNCNTKQEIPNTCPNCHNILLETIGFGIDKIKKELNNYLILTKDTKNKQEIIQEFNNSDKNLLGTQIIFNPNIQNTNTVISLSLDHLFIYPEYNQEEKILQHLLNLKNKTNKKLIIQTYLKDTEIFKNFKENKIKEIYKNNLKLQKQLNYPPFSQLTKISLKNKNKIKIEVEIFNTYKHLKTIIEKNNLQNIIEISGPYPILNEKENDYYVYNILIKTILSKENLIKITDLKKRNFILNQLNKNWKIDIDPISTI